jgi:hypothetical protein
MASRNHVIRGVLVAIAVFVASSLVLAAMAASPAAARKQGKEKERMEPLEAPREIAGVPCRTRASFDAEGRLRSCVLSRDTTFANGLTLPEGTQAGFDEEGRPSRAFLPANTSFDGHLCIGTGTHDAITTFHPNGRLAFCNLARPESIGGVPCQQSSFWTWVTQGGSGTYFHDNGVLKSCLLADDVTVAGRTYRKKEHLALDRNGVPIP